MDSAGNSASLQSSSGGGGDDDFDATCGGGAVDSSSPLSALLRHPPSPSVPDFGGGGSLVYGLQELATPPLSHWCPTTTAALSPAGADASSPPSLPYIRGLAASAEPDHAATAPAAQPAAPPRGARKRARASRRAPTTVLTTDTSNFRAMVQEFTGIPAPPFAGAPGSRSRFDHLFRSRSPSSALPQYLLRPLAHKLHASYPPPFTSPASTCPPAPANVAIAAPAAAPGATAVPSGDSYQQLTTAAPSALLGTHDHNSNSSYLSFQRTLGAHLDGGDAKSYPMFDRGAEPPSSAPTLKQDPTDFLGVAHGIMSSEGTHSHWHPRNGDRGRAVRHGRGWRRLQGDLYLGAASAGRQWTTEPAVQRLHSDNDDGGAGGGNGGHANARRGLMGVQHIRE